MRKFLFFKCLIFIAGAVFSQSLNVAEHDHIEGTSNIISINSKVFYFETWKGSCCATKASFRGRDKSGNTIVNTPVISPSRDTYPGKVIRTLDNALFLNFLNVYSCDQGGHQDYLVKMDTNGTVIFSVTLEPGWASGFGATVLDITQHPDSSYYLVSRKELYHYSSTGQFISKILTGLNPTKIVKALSNGNLVLHGELNGVNQNMITTVTGSILSQQIVPYQVKKVIQSAANLFALTTAGFIEKYDLTLATVASSTLSVDPVYYGVSDFDMRNDSVFVTGGTNAGTIYYGVMDNTLTSLYQSVSSYRGLIPTGIAITSDNKANVIATCRSADPDYLFKSYNKFGLTQGFGFKHDIGVIGFSNLDTWLNPNGGFQPIPTLSMDVTVKNFGVDTVKSFYVNSLATQMWCYLLLHKKCETPIAPGQTLSISTGLFYGQIKNSNNATLAMQKIKICLFTTIPNGSNDANILNDGYCDSLLFTTTGISKDPLNETSLQLFPNPFQNTLSIHAQTEIQSLELTDQLGSLLQKVWINDKNAELSWAHLPPGIYFVKVSTEKTITVKKVIKE